MESQGWGRGGGGGKNDSLWLRALCPAKWLETQPSQVGMLQDRDVRGTLEVLQGLPRREQGGGAR